MSRITVSPVGDGIVFSSKTAAAPALPDTLDGGARRDRTDDLMLAKHALSQLSYGPYSGQACLVGLRLAAGATLIHSVVGLGRFELPTSRLSSARSNQLSYRPVVGGLQSFEERETKTAVSRDFRREAWVTTQPLIPKRVSRSCRGITERSSSLERR
jgi:hypothetical protein